MSAAVGTEIPFNALGRATAAIRPQLDAAIARVVDSGWYVLGPEHDAVEAELAAYVGVDHAIGVGNGTDALQLALTAVGVTSGDRVMTVANAGGYTSTAARSIGAVPVYADVDPSSLLLTPQTLETALDRDGITPAAVVVTHLFGAMADAEAIVAIAHERGIPVIEDCAQALGARNGSKMAGSIADVATASFYPTKNLGALGDGGAVLTSDPTLAHALRELRQYGWESKYRTARAHGRNSRLDELQAAILRVKLPLLDGWNERRREIHRRFEEAVSLPARLVSSSSERFTGHLAVLEVDDRAAAQQLFAAHGVRTDVHYPIADHRQPLLADVEVPSLAVTERAAERILSIPLFPELTDSEVERICVALGEL